MPSFNKALKEKTPGFSNATSIIFEAKSSRTGGTQIGESSAYAIVEENTLYVYTAADEFMFNRSSYEMFSGMASITEIDFGDFINTSQVENMGWMFYNCSKLKSLDLSNFYTSKVTNMGLMFYDCTGLESLILSNFDTSEVTSMNSMFYSCEKLTTLDLCSFTFPVGYALYDIFSFTYSLKVYVKDNDEWDKIKGEQVNGGSIEVCPGHNESSPM